ncbi:MAG: hypothetical protein ACK4K7_13990 [Allosphingosinicella sp.]|uniref:hypothetical protein n=1 Tax=Allosphingosinicella sp. TaxID=2823234 RepID=UPI00392494D3
MNAILIALAASAAQVLPDIDRASLDLQARAEALQEPAGRRSLDIASVSTICNAAAGQPDPAAFIATLSRAYALSRSEGASLRSNCAAYMAGRADAGRKLPVSPTY